MMKPTFAISCLLMLTAAGAPGGVALDGVDATAPDSSASDDVRPIPGAVFQGSPGDRIRALLEYADLPLSEEMSSSVSSLVTVLDAVALQDGWVLDATVEACNGAGTCGGTYSPHNHSAVAYAQSGNLTGNACSDNVVNVNFALGNNNNYCYQRTDSTVTIETSDGTCTFSQHDAPQGYCGGGSTIVGFVVFFVCTSEFLHRPGPCPGLVDL